MQKTAPASSIPVASPATAAAFPIVLALSFAHFLNDLVQSLLPAIYPIIKDTYNLNYTQIGILTLAFQLTASMLQPMVGLVTDRKPQPFSLVAGMMSTLVGLIILAYAGSYAMLLFGACLVGTGSAIFHPEATRMARMASGGRHGFAQSVFQVGGQGGQAFGPLLAAFIIVPLGQASLSWFSVAVLVAMVVLFQVGTWYKAQNPQAVRPKAIGAMPVGDGSAEKALRFAIFVIVMLMFSKSAYTAVLSKYYTFYTIDTFSVSVQTSQILLFVFLIFQVVGALVGGYLGDRLGRRRIIWFSILGALPFTLALPYANLPMTIVLTALIAMIMSSAFPALLVYALDLMPGKIGMVAGVFYGVSFGLGAVSAALLGVIADWTSLTTVYKLCSLLPLLGLLAWFLPNVPQSAVRVKH